jgi:hypothetical protein
VETPLSVAQITRDFSGSQVFCEQSHSHQKRSQKRKLTIFGNTKQVIQDYDTVFDRKDNGFAWPPGPAGFFFFF